MPKTAALPGSPEQLLEELFTIFPQYRVSYSGPIDDDSPTFHSVLIAFASFFGGAFSLFSERQLKSFGALASAAIDAGGSLGNAFDTCLLEHLHQIHAVPFWKQLSKNARDKTKA